jgi:predicted Rossmann fold flavoprotein
MMQGDHQSSRRPAASTRPRRVAVVGAGAAGSVAAIFAAKAGAETVLLEQTKDGGRKLLVTGGGRCNILPVTLDESRFVTDSSPNILRKILRSWPLAEQIRFFEGEVGLELVEEAGTGKLFPRSQRARDVRDGLFALARAKGARLEMGARVTACVPIGDGWRIERSEASALEVDAVILATGGLSLPGTGSDGFGFTLASQLGHLVVPTYPALTPLVASPAPLGLLAGISLDVTLTADDGRLSATATGSFLFTHQGYSGPVVLDVSHVAVRSGVGGERPARLRACWTRRSEATWDTALRAGGRRRVVTVLRDELPDRLARALLGVAGIGVDCPLAELRRDQRCRLLDALLRSELTWTGHGGYDKAEITGGGVALSEIHPRTLESRKHPGLFFCGELLDAFGPIGGYNLAWAWVTGRAAGIGASLAGIPV